MWRLPRPPLVFWLVWTLGGIVTFLVAGVVINMAQVLLRLVFFRYLISVDPGGWMASPTTTLIFLEGRGLSLVSEGRGVVGLSLVFVLGGFILGLPVGVLHVFFRRRTMAFRAPSINVPNVEGRLQVSLGLCITRLLHNFF